MFGVEKRMLMRRYLQEGLSKAATARLLGISRRTIYNWIEAGELERSPGDTGLQYGPRAPRPTQLDPYKETIDARLAEFPQLNAARLFREVKEAGYPGGYGQVKRYVRKKRRAALPPPASVSPPSGPGADATTAPGRHEPTGRREHA